MSVRKRTWKTADGEGREAWLVDYFDQAGKRRAQTFDRKKDALEYHATVKVDVRQGLHTPQNKGTTVAEAAEDWISFVELEKRERSTVTQYRQHVALHIVPRIGREKLAKLTTPRINAFRDDLLANLSRAMAKKVLTSLKSLLRDAKRRGNVAQNVALDVSIKADKRSKKKLKVGVDIPTTDEIRLITHAATGKDRPLLLTAIFAGLRSSELRGLRWSDVDLKKGELHVRQRADRWNAIGKPKSEIRRSRDPARADRAQRAEGVEARLPERRARSRVSERRRQARKSRQHCNAHSMPGAGRGRRRHQQWHSQVHRPALAATFLRLVVHQPREGWRARAASKDCAGADGAQLDRDDDGYIRPSLPTR